MFQHDWSLFGYRTYQRCFFMTLPSSIINIPIFKTSSLIGFRCELSQILQVLQPLKSADLAWPAMFWVRQKSLPRSKGISKKSGAVSFIWILTGHLYKSLNPGLVSLYFGSDGGEPVGNHPAKLHMTCQA